MFPSRQNKDHRVKAFRHRAFTLIELLLVILVVAILAVLLSPVVTKVREQWQTTQCVSRLKNLSSAFHMFVSNNNGDLPVSLGPDASGNLTSPFISQLVPYLEPNLSFYPYTNPDGSVSAQKRRWNSYWWCPATRKDTPGNSLSTYGLNHSFRNIQTAPETEKASITPMKLSAVPHPTQTAMFACILSGYTVPHNRAYVGGSGTLSPQHKGGFNVIFVDGHVEHIVDLISPSDPRCKLYWTLNP